MPNKDVKPGPFPIYHNHKHVQVEYYGVYLTESVSRLFQYNFYTDDGEWSMGCLNTFVFPHIGLLGRFKTPDSASYIME